MEKTTAESSIIKFLRSSGGHVSGEMMSRRLGVSRAAVWKHVESLRKAGYRITASPRKGYALNPGHCDKRPFNAVELLASLRTKVIGKRVFFYPSLDSTNTKAFELAKGGEPEGSVVVADGQRRGKGRLGRFWHSPAGVNLYTSIILKPKLPPARAHTLTLLAGLAAAEAIEKFSPVRPEVKWPNDILIGSKKVCGILTEMSSEADRINFVVTGIGVNLNMNMESVPSAIKDIKDVKKIATSLKKIRGADVDRLEFAQTLYSSVEKWYKVFLKEGLIPILTAWKHYFEKEGKPVKIKGFNNATEGICMGIDPDGALLVRIASGRIERVIAGDMQ